MHTHTPIPVIFLAFANDKQEPDRFLRSLTYEKNKIEKSLREAMQNGLCEVVIKTDVRVNDILDTFQDQTYSGRIRIFHFSGHADGYQLLLESIRGDQSMAHGEGLVSYLKRRKELQLIFLNGCSTRQMAQELVEQGVPAVIGTSESIADEMAATLGSRFYFGLGQGLSVEEAWKSAEDEAKMKKGGIAGEQDRSIKRKRTKKKTSDFPWHMYIAKDESEVKSWNLRDASSNPLFGLELPKNTYYQSNQFPPEPYVGLRYFQKKDAAIFFGRGAQIRQLYNLIRGINPIILFYGKSGVGKSSLLEAGLLPRIEGEYTVHYKRRVQKIGLGATLMSMLDDCLEELGLNQGKLKARSTRKNKQSEDLKLLRQTVSRLKGPELQLELESLIQKLKKNKPEAEDKLPDILRIWRIIEQKNNKPLLLILDQVEEKFTRPMSDLSDHEDELTGFLKQIQPLFNHEKMGIRGKLILGFRKEYYTEIRDAFQKLSLPISEIFLQRLDRAGIVEAVNGISQNAYTKEHYKLSITPHKGIDLAGMIADDLLEDKASPVAPVLQITLKKLWEQAKANRKDEQEWKQFSVDMYQRLKKEGTTMSEFFDQQMEKLASKYGGANEWIRSGLVQDILQLHTTDIGTAGSVRLWDMLNRYSIKAASLRKLIQELQDLSLLVQIGSSPQDQLEADKAYLTLLAHDTLAPVVIRAFNDSDLPGQRAARILTSKMRNVSYMLTQESFDLMKKLKVPEEVLNKLNVLESAGFKGFDRFQQAIHEKLEIEESDEYMPNILLSMKSDFELLKQELLLNEADVGWVKAGRQGMRKLRKQEEELLAFSEETAEKRKKELAEALARTQRQLVQNYYANALSASKEGRFIKAAHHLAKSVEAGAELEDTHTFIQRLGLQNMGYLDISLEDRVEVGFFADVSADKKYFMTTDADHWYHNKKFMIWDFDQREPIEYETSVGGAFMGDGKKTILLLTTDSGYVHPVFWKINPEEKIVKAIEIKDEFVPSENAHISGFTRMLNWIIIETSKGFHMGRLNRSGDRISMHSEWQNLDSYRFSGNGKYLITQSDGGLKIWNAKSGRKLPHTFDHPESVDQYAIHPEKPLLFVSGEKVISIWNYETGTSIGEPIKCERKSESKVEYSGYGIFGQFFKSRPLLIYYFLNEARFINTEDGSLAGEVITNKENIEGVILTEGESEVITWDSDRFVRLWDVDSRKLTLELEHELPFIEKVYVNEEKLQLTCISKKSVQYFGPNRFTQWDLSTKHTGYGNLAQDLPIDLDIANFWLNEAGITLYVFGYRNDLISRQHDSPGFLQVYVYGNLVLETRHMHPDGPVFNEDKTLMLTWHEQLINVWNVDTAERVGTQLYHNSDIHYAFFKEGLIHSFTVKGEHYKWQIRENMNTSGSLFTKLPVNGDSWGTVVEFQQDADRWLIWNREELILWDSKRNKKVKTFSPQEGLNEVKISRDGSFLIAYSQHNYPPETHLYAFDMISGKLLGELEFTGDYLDAIRSGNQLLILTGLNQGSEFYIWSLITGKHAFYPVTLGQGINYASFIHGGKSLLINHSNEMELQLWDIKSNDFMGEKMLHDSTESYLYGRNSKFIISCYDHSIYVWDIKSGTQVGKIIGDETQVSGFAVSEDESMVLSWGQMQGDEKYMLRIWDTLTGASIAPPMIHGEYCTAIFSPDGTFVLSWDNTCMKVWHTKDGSPAFRTIIPGYEFSNPVFTADSKRIIAYNDEDKCIYEWNIGLEIDILAEEIPLQIEICTATKMDDVGNIIPLSIEEWNEKRAHQTRLSFNNA